MIWMLLGVSILTLLAGYLEYKLTDTMFSDEDESILNWLWPTDLAIMVLCAAAYATGMDAYSGASIVLAIVLYLTFVILQAFRNTFAFVVAKTSHVVYSELGERRIPVTVIGLLAGWGTMLVLFIFR